MIILFISSLSANIASGMSWSVPASVEAQSKIDNVLWINLSNAYIEHWSHVKAYHNYREYGKRLQLKKLPYPFNKPDIVVFEGVYDLKSPIFARELRKNRIPYIIVPRCALTYKGQNNNSKWKKRIANFFIFNRFIRKADSIQYLTASEKKSSSPDWNKHDFILPNGFTTPKRTKTEFISNGIKAIFIGRLDMYQKGLDVLLEAFNEVHSILRENNFTLCIYGPKTYQYKELQKYIDDKKMDDIVSLGGEIKGITKENVLLSSDLFILTSRFEGHPMALIEALAYGVPSLVSSGSNMMEEIMQSDSGWVCEELNSSNVASKLLDIIKEKDLFKIKSENAKRLSENYDWSVISNALHRELKKIINDNVAALDI